MVKKYAVSEILYEHIFDAIPIGLFLIGQDYRVYAWNSWMAVNTNITLESACGQKFKSLYSNEQLRFDWALETVLNQGHPQFLSTILNKFIIPIPLNKKKYPGLEMMQQQIEILPLHYNDENMALVVIQDVTDKIHLQNTLTSMAIRLETNSLIDSLTGLYNRRFLWKYLESELDSARREHYNVVCCLFDLDYFKSINDEFGHNAGDEMLVSFSKIATTIIRPKDCIIRYGGEEFLAIFTRIEIVDSIKLANRIREKLESTPLHGKLNKIITCSGGLSYWQPSDPIISAEKLVNQADVELYKAKKMGRNCIIVKERA